MTMDERLVLLKADLELLSNVKDAYLKHLLAVAGSGSRQRASN